MKCITSPALDDIQIMSYIEGEADDATVAHINKCPFCAEKANRWVSVQKRLREQLYRVTCPSPMELGDYHLGVLPVAQKLVVAQHVRECPLCRHEVTELESFLDDPTAENNLLKAAKVLIARLINGPTESGRQISLHALRGEAKGPLTFKADGIVIVVDLQPGQDGKADLLGQLAADNTEEQDQWTGALVELRKESRLEFSAILDDLGGFGFKGILPGNKELHITTKDNSLTVVSNFEVSN